MPYINLHRLPGWALELNVKSKNLLQIIFLVFNLYIINFNYCSIFVQLITGHIDILREEFGDIFREKDKEISNLKLELSSLRAKMAILEERHDDADAYERRDTLLISGDGVPHVAAGENCNALVCSMVKEKLKINISPNDISTSHRTGPKPRSPQVADKRNIIVKLCRRDLKGELLSACRKCKPNFYINESLTPTRSAILYALRKAKNISPGVVAGCNSENGRVYAYVKNRDAAGDVTIFTIL